MREMPGVRRVHDLHVWTLTSGKEAMSAHVVVDGVAEGDRLTQALHDLLHERFGVEHTTIQLESEPLVQIGVSNQSPPGNGNTPPAADRP